MSLKRKKGEGKQSSSKSKKKRLQQVTQESTLEKLDRFSKTDLILHLDTTDKDVVRGATGLIRAIVPAATSDESSIVFCKASGDNGTVVGISLRQGLPGGHKVDSLSSEKNGIILGPETVDGRSSEEIREFYQLWGKSHCQLRRFQNGQTHETVALSSPYGLAYFPMVKLQHVLKVHYPEVGSKFHSLSEGVLVEAKVANDQLASLRSLADNFTTLLRRACETTLPLRNVRAICSSLYKGFANGHDHFLRGSHVQMSTTSKIVKDMDGYLVPAEKNVNAPEVRRSLLIEVEITQKSHLREEVFARLRMAYVLKLRTILAEDLQLQTMVTSGGELKVVFQGAMFCVRVKPLLQDDDKSKVHGLQELLARISQEHTSYSGVCSILHRWMASNFLSDGGGGVGIPEVVLDLIVASVYSNLDKLKGTQQTPVTIEAGLLAVLRLLSMTDFKTTPIFVGSEAEDFSNLDAFKWTFSNKRSTLPDLCIVTPHEDKPSIYTKSLNPQHFRRLINCARMTLHKMFTPEEAAPNFDGLTDGGYGGSEHVYDFTVYLHRHHVPRPGQGIVERQPSLGGESMKSFPVTDYDPLERFFTEVKASFGRVADFYFNRDTLVLGVKLSKDGKEKTKEIKEDINIIGRDLVKHVTENKSV